MDLTEDGSDVELIDLEDTDDEERENPPETVKSIEYVERGDDDDFIVILDDDDDGDEPTVNISAVTNRTSVSILNE